MPGANKEDRNKRKYWSIRLRKWKTHWTEGKQWSFEKIKIKKRSDFTKMGKDG
jgi:hypothetical protein